MSPSGSWHLWFAWPGGIDVRNSEGTVKPGVDVRGNGGMVVAAPSVKPGNPAPYRWINPPGVYDFAPCPDWLLQKCLKRPVTKGDMEDVVLDALGTAPRRPVRGWA